MTPRNFRTLIMAIMLLGDDPRLVFQVVAQVFVAPMALHLHRQPLSRASARARHPASSCFLPERQRAAVKTSLGRPREHRGLSINATLEQACGVPQATLHTHRKGALWGSCFMRNGLIIDDFGMFLDIFGSFWMFLAKAPCPATCARACWRCGQPLPLRRRHRTP